MAGTASSRPAWMWSASSAAAASGEAGSFVIATVSAPLRRAASTTATTSGLWPDCEIATTSPPRQSSLAPYTVVTDGLTSPVGSPRCVSNRYCA